jgi:tellurite resistance protein
MEESIKAPCRIEHLPVSFFSVVMGLTGFAIAFQRAEMFLDFPGNASIYILDIAVVVFVALSILYAVKLIRFPKQVIKEFQDPVKIAFFPAISISLLLLSIAFMTVYVPASQYLWYVGTVAHLLFTLAIISVWMHHEHFNITHMNPAWFIPAVGNIMVPISGVLHASPLISWFFFSVGFIFWIVLLAIFFNRIIFHNPLPEKLIPTLFILIAPPAVGMIAHVQLTGMAGELDLVLYNVALFLALLLFSQARYFFKTKFFLSWWAYSFPVAALSIASAVLVHHTNIAGFGMIGKGALFVLTAIILILVVQTVYAIRRKEICVEEH